MPIGKKKFLKLKIDAFVHKDVFQVESGSRDRLAGGLADRDCFSSSPTGTGAGAHSPQQPVSPAPAAEALPKELDKAFIPEKANVYGPRLETAINAEHLEELTNHALRLGGSRGKLVADGTLLLGINITHRGREQFVIARADGLPFNLTQYDFKRNTRVAIFRDTQPANAVDLPPCEDDGSVATGPPPLKSGKPDRGKDSTPTAASAATPPRRDESSRRAAGPADSPVKPGGGKEGSEDASDDDEPTACDPNRKLVKERDRKAQEVAQLLARLHLVHYFDGAIAEVSDYELVVSTRDVDAPRRVEEAYEGNADSDSDSSSDRGDTKEPPRWALMSSFNDITYRRQGEAAKALGELYTPRPYRAKAATAQDGRSPPGANATSTAQGQHAPQQAQLQRLQQQALAAAPRVGELRVRRVVLSDPYDAAQAAEGRAAAAEAAGWLAEAERREVEALLCGPDSGLNEEQREALLEVGRRSVTLIQGPPGTGKTRTLTAMAAALFQVFHRPPALRDESYMFDLPSSRDPKEWTHAEVTEWIESFRVPPDLPYLKDLALGVAQGYSGEAIFGWPPGRISSLFLRQAEAVGLGGVGEMRAKECAGAFNALRREVPRAVEQCRRCEGPWSSAYWRTGGRDMRMVLCADTNTAANRLLEMFVDQLPHPEDCSVLRMGVVQEGEEGSALAREYHIDRLRDQHPLVLIGRELVEAAKRDQLNEVVGKRLQAGLRDYIAKLRDQAAKSRRPLVREKRMELAERLAGSGTGDCESQDSDDEATGSKEKEARAIQDKFKDVLYGYLRAKNPRYPSYKLQQRAVKAAQRAIEKMAKVLRDVALCDILIPVHVVVGTHTSMGELRMPCVVHGLTFPIVIIDEAGQASEPSCMISLTLGAEWVLMGGDTKQLPPTLLSDVARKVLGYYTRTGGSLYGRFLKMGIMECRLATQYRMHPLIRGFPSITFYEGRLKEDPDNPPDTRVPQPSYGCYNYAPFPLGRPVVFYDVRYGEERRMPTGHSRYNEEEAALALRLLVVLGADPTVRSIFIVTPYKAQEDYIGKRLESGRGYLENIRPAGMFFPEEYGVRTVDGYQGREADVVIFSTVRSNDSGDIGHLMDTRRLNVAITRARRGLIFLGNAHTLRCVRHGAAFNGADYNYNLWPELLEHIRGQGGAVMDARDLVLPALPNCMECTNAEASGS